MQGDIVAQGTELMLYGMGTVVFFLALLVVVTSLMSGFLSRYFPDTEIASARVPRGVPSGIAAAENDVDTDIAVAISAALHQHRSK